MTLFVDPSIAKQFECAICLETYKEPIAVGTEHTNIKMRRSKRLKDQTDRQNNRKRSRSISDEDEEFDNNHNKKRRKLNEIELSEICEWKGLYSESDNHIKICPLQSISCKYCTHSMLQRELEKHHE
eukprot:401551_1